MAIEGIVFDMDGVLIDSHPVHKHAWRKFLTTVGRNVTDNDLDFILEGRRREEILKHFLGDLPLETLIEYGRQKDRIYEENFRKITLVPGVIDFIRDLESHSLHSAVATSASSARTFDTLERLGLGTAFSTVVTGDDVEVGKPHPAAYQLASERMKLCPESLLVLEDALCGVQAARAAGMRCIGVTKNGKSEALRQAGASYIIPDFVDFSVEKMMELSWQ